MLKLERRATNDLKSSLIIADGLIEVKILSVRGSKVTLGIEAPRDIEVDRKEKYVRQQAEREAATTEVQTGHAPVPGMQANVQGEVRQPVQGMPKVRTA